MGVFSEKNKEQINKENDNIEQKKFKNDRLTTPKLNLKINKFNSFKINGNDDNDSGLTTQSIDLFKDVKKNDFIAPKTVKYEENNDKKDLKVKTVLRDKTQDELHSELQDKIQDELHSELHKELEGMNELLLSSDPKTKDEEKENSILKKDDILQNIENKIIEKKNSSPIKFSIRVEETIKDEIDKKISDNIKIETKNNNKTKHTENIKIQEIPATTEKNNIENKVIYSQILEDASGIQPNLFNKRYPTFDEKKYYKLEDTASNQDLFDLVSKRTDLEGLDISNCTFIYDFFPINKLKKLKQFSAHNCKTMSNVDFLIGIEDLEVLNLSCNPISDISFIVSKTPKLKVLNIATTKISSLEGLRNCQELIELILWGCFGIDDLNELEYLNKLRLIDIDSTNVSDLFPLINSKKLEFLYADNCSGIREFSSFEALKGSLRVLLLDGNSMIPMAQLEYIATLENLEILTLKFRKITSGFIFKNMKKLTNLDLDGSLFSDVSYIGNLIELKTLNLTGNSAIRDVSSLSKLVNLKKLIIGGGGSSSSMKDTKTSAGVSTSSQMLIEDFSVISNLVNLDTLNISNNPKVRSINGIKNCVNMEEVYMEKCTQMEDINELVHLKKLRIINLNFCPKIKDMYFLQYLENLIDLQFDGTIADSVAFLTQFKKAIDIFSLRSYGNDLLTQNITKSSKKKVKLFKFMKKNLKVIEEE